MEGRRAEKLSALIETSRLLQKCTVLRKPVVGARHGAPRTRRSGHGEWRGTSRCWSDRVANGARAGGGTPGMGRRCHRCPHVGCTRRNRRRRRDPGEKRGGDRRTRPERGRRPTGAAERGRRRRGRHAARHVHPYLLPGTDGSPPAQRGAGRHPADRTEQTGIGTTTDGWSYDGVRHPRAVADHGAGRADEPGAWYDGRGGRKGKRTRPAGNEGGHHPDAGRTGEDRPGGAPPPGRQDPQESGGAANGLQPGEREGGRRPGRQ